MDKTKTITYYCLSCGERDIPPEEIEKDRVSGHIIISHKIWDSGNVYVCGPCKKTRPTDGKEPT